MACVDTSEATISKTDDQPRQVTAPIASVRTAKPRKMTRRKDSPLCSIAAEVAVRPALKRLSAAAVCAPSSRLLHAQMIPARLDWTRSDLSQVRTSALTLSTSALKPVAWISRSVGMDEGRATKGATANDVRPVGESSMRRTSIYGQRRLATARNGRFGRCNRARACAFATKRFRRRQPGPSAASASGKLTMPSSVDTVTRPETKLAWPPSRAAST